MGVDVSIFSVLPPVQRCDSTNVANTDACRFPAECGTSESPWPAPAATVVPTVALGKRRREAEEPHGDEDPVGIDTPEIPPPKRARGGSANGILKTARSTARTSHKTVARTQKTKIDGKPKEAGRGAERLATPNAQGIYHQSSLGPLQQGWVEEAANGTLIWVAGRVDETVVQHSDSAVQQQQQQDEEENKSMIHIPRKFKPVHMALLRDLKDGMVPEIRCRLCPETELKSWEEYKRHCDTNEAHPQKLSFCDTCGDHFARGDSLGRHRQKPPPECKKVKPEMAAEKRRETQLAHDRFLKTLEECLRTGENIVTPFSQIIKGKYPESSKKRIGGRRT